MSKPIEPIVSVTEYRVSCVPEEYEGWYHFMLTVENRGNDRWAVCRQGACVNQLGVWSYEPINSEQTDEWRAEHRFDLETALELAKQEAPLVTVNNMTVMDVKRRNG